MSKWMDFAFGLTLLIIGVSMFILVCAMSWKM
jgi:hypothetical protein